MPRSGTTPYRWTVLALLFFATTINYLDRIVFAVLSPVIREELKFNDQEYGYLTASFQVAYTFGFLVAGKFIDRFGTKAGYAVSIVWWSIAAGLHAFARTPIQLGVWRALLGLGEGGNFPAAIKSVAEWFPKKDRAFATGIFNAGTNVAAMVGPPLFVWMNAVWGWRTSFVATASTGLLWVIAWLILYRQPPEIVHAGAEVDAVGQVGWRGALGKRQTWGFAAAKFFSDPVWWFYLYWLPPYLYDVRKFKLTEIGWALPVIYIAADIGSVGGGWFSGYLMRRGWEMSRARRFSMLLFALCMPVAAVAVLMESPAAAIALVSLATAAHQGWSANLYTTVSDAFPKESVASVTGIGGCAGGIGGIIFSALLPGYIVQNFGYTPMFLMMGGFHLVGWALINRLLWRGPAPGISA